MPIRETSDRQVNDLLSDFNPKGGVVTKLPNIKEVRDLTMLILKQGNYKYLMMAVDGKWEMINILSPTWDDLRFPASTGKLPASSTPTWTDYKGGQILEFSTGEKIFFLVQLPHDWVEGSSIEPHIHLVINGTPANNIEFTLTYSFANINGVFPTETSIVKEMSVADKVSGQHFILDFDPIDMKKYYYLCYGHYFCNENSTKWNGFRW